VNNLAKNAIPLAKTVSDFIKVTQYLPAAFYYGDWEYKKGGLKGQNKFYANLNKLVVGAKPTQDVWKLLNENPLDY